MTNVKFSYLGFLSTCMREAVSNKRNKGYIPLKMSNFAGNYSFIRKYILYLTILALWKGFFHLNDRFNHYNLGHS